MCLVVCRVEFVVSGLDDCVNANNHYLFLRFIDCLLLFLRALLLDGARERRHNVSYRMSQEFQLWWNIE